MDIENYEYAGFWVRFSAFLIDLLIMTIVIYAPLSYIYGAEYWNHPSYIHGFWDFVLGYVLPCVATIWLWHRFLGTPGKMALRLRIVHAETGQPMSVGQSIGRYFAYILSMLPICLGFIWIGVDGRKQGWHDKLANSVVIRDVRKVAVTFG